MINPLFFELHTWHLKSKTKTFCQDRQEEDLVSSIVSNLLEQFLILGDMFKIDFPLFNKNTDLPKIYVLFYLNILCLAIN